MKKKLLKKFIGEIVLLFATFIISILVCLFIKKTWELGQLDTVDWLSVVLTSTIIPAISLIIHLFRILNRQLGNSLMSIQSKIIKDVAHSFGDESINIISNNPLAELN